LNDTDIEQDCLKEAKIIDSWKRNAGPWAAAVRRREIESRLVTDAAIVDVIRRQAPRTVLDLGCGEGWLARALAADAIKVTGLDVVPELIHRAREAGGGSFRVASFDDVVTGRVEVAAHLAVCNFSLLGKESVERLLAALPSLLDVRGILVMQTVHPLMVLGADLPYRSGWREETWAGFRGQFCSTAPWYFRTLPDWIDLLRDSGFQLIQLREPLHPVTGKPLSLILVASALALHGSGV